MSCLHFVSHLYQQLQDKNAEVSSFLLSTMIWVIPCINPDTYDLNIREYRQTVNKRMNRYGNYRKNRRETCQRALHNKLTYYYFFIRKSFDHGIDLNRNFPVCFDIDEEGSSGNSCSEIYRVCLVISLSYRVHLRFLKKKHKPSVLLWNDCL